MDKKGKGHGQKGKKHSGGGGSKAKGSNKGGSSSSHTAASSAKEPRQDWTCLEQFMLSFMVKTYGEKNWIEVSKNLIYHEERLTRPKEWYTEKRCSDEYKEMKKFYLSSKGIRFADELTEEFVHRAIALECKDEMLKEKFQKIEERKAKIRKDLAELNICGSGRVKQMSTNETFREFMRSDRGINMIRALTIDQLRKFAAETGDEVPDSLVELLSRRPNLPELPTPIENQPIPGSSDAATSSATVTKTITPAGPVSNASSAQIVSSVSVVMSASVLNISSSVGPSLGNTMTKTSLPIIVDGVSGGQGPSVSCHENASVEQRVKPTPRTEMTSSIDLDLTTDDIEVLTKSDSAIPPECFMEGDMSSSTSTSTNTPERTISSYDPPATKSFLDSPTKSSLGIEDSMTEVAAPSQDISAATAASTSISAEIKSSKYEDESQDSSILDESQIEVVELSSDTSQDPVFPSIDKPPNPQSSQGEEENKSGTQEMDSPVKEIGTSDSFVQQSKEGDDDHWSDAQSGGEDSTDEKSKGQTMESSSSFSTSTPSPTKFVQSPISSPVGSPTKASTILSPPYSPIGPSLMSPIKTSMVPPTSPVKSPVVSPMVSPFVSPTKSPPASTVVSPFVTPTKVPIVSEITPTQGHIHSPLKVTSQSPRPETTSTIHSVPSGSSESIISIPPKITPAGNASEYDFDMDDVPPPLPLVKKPQRQYPGPMTRREERLKDSDTEPEPEVEISVEPKHQVTRTRKITAGRFGPIVGRTPLLGTSSSSVSTVSSEDTFPKKTLESPTRAKSPGVDLREREPPKRTYDLSSNRRSTRLSALPSVEMKLESRNEGDDMKKSATSIDLESESKSLKETGSIKIEGSVVVPEETKAAIISKQVESGEIRGRAKVDQEELSFRQPEEHTPNTSPRNLESPTRSPRKMEETALKVVRGSKYEERTSPSHLRSKVGSTVKSGAMEMPSPDITNLKACVEKDKRTRARTRQSAPLKVYEREKSTIEESDSDGDGDHDPESKQDSDDTSKSKKKRNRRSRLNFLRDEASLIYGNLEENPDPEGDAKRRTRGSARTKPGSMSERDVTPDPKTSTSEEFMTAGPSTERETVAETPLASSTPISVGPKTRNEENNPDDLKKSLLRIYNRLLSIRGSSIFQKKRGEGPGESAVRRPMDLNEIKANIENGNIKNIVDLERDVLLMCCNFTMCYTYNLSEQSIEQGKLYVSRAIQYLEDLKKEGEEGSTLPGEGTSNMSASASADFATPTTVKRKGLVRGRKLSLTEEPEESAAAVASNETSDESYDDEKTQGPSTSGGSSGQKTKQNVLPEEKAEESMGKKLRGRGGRPTQAREQSKSRGRHSAN